MAAVCAGTAMMSSAQTFNTLVSFDATYGGNLRTMSLIQGPDGSLYGTTFDGGANGYGSVFKVTLAGVLTTLHSFDVSDGGYLTAGLTLSADGNFYGTTSEGGPNGYGTAFKITPAGAITTLCSFGSTNAYPQGALVRATDGNFYGTTQGSGSNYGTVFRMTPSGTTTTLYAFDYTTGAYPMTGLLVASNGSLYGMTNQGGMDGPNCYGGCGTIFKVTPSGVFTLLHSFDGADGANPYTSSLIEGVDGNVYGTIPSGGSIGFGTVFKMSLDGTTFTTFYNFCIFDCADGDAPFAGLIQGADGSFYGETAQGGAIGGAIGDGTIFSITPAGALTTLHVFDLTDGGQPAASLVQSTNGTFYGTTSEGGVYNYGTVFSLSVGLPRFVEAVPTSGRPGTRVAILGTSLEGATSVVFNGTAATFTVVSPSLITTTVPAGATTGKIQVVTPGGTLSSNVPFRVIP
ncbi:MAG TPA: choice-of-anchor tandem repeat GloVer-containing protein [Terriglobia bacterium]|nr:choice-of-anchor tandem repeat GloVer-containing protein [Terriglobia bacterium]